MGAEVFFEPLDIMAMLISALIHDLDHPGLDNSYQVCYSTTERIFYYYYF